AGAAPAEGAPAREDRGPRRDHDAKGRDQNRDRNKGGKFGGDREGRGGRDFGKGGRDKREGGPALRPYASSGGGGGGRDRDRPVDPNSPFAKLAALKEQLAANNRKD
ncbi:hypothetical protein, partial [Bradyrhizobium sp. ORS 375]|uniref:hypothetical protein n=1 Tax=Bradyrhizobium sp. (strain ORS 375) TaxID=566679 RepID=UPI00055705DB